jgi:hypothetical protein
VGIDSFDDKLSVGRKTEETATLSIAHFKICALHECLHIQTALKKHIKKLQREKEGERSEKTERKQIG